MRMPAAPAADDKRPAIFCKMPAEIERKVAGNGRY